MVLQQTDQLADFEQLLYQQIRVVQNNRLGIKGKLLDVIADDTNMGLDKLNIEQGFASPGKVGKIIRDSRLTVATVYTKNILRVERVEGN